MNDTELNCTIRTLKIMPKKNTIIIKGLNSYEKRNAKGEIVKDKRGTPLLAWKYRYIDREGKRRTIYLGEGVSKQDAVYYAENLSRLVQCSKTPGAVLPPEVQTFIDNVDYSFRKKLLEVGLIDETERDTYESAATIGTLTDAYLKYHEGGNVNTLKNLNLAVSKLLKHFSRDKKICDLSITDVKRFQDYLYANYAKASASRLVGRTREICLFGIRSKLLTHEFYDDTFAAVLKRTSEINKERQQNVSLEMFEKIVTACNVPELQFSLFFARFLAFRVPTECQAFRWSFISFADKRVRVQDIKRKTIREVPLFPHLIPFISELFHYYRCDSFIKDVKSVGLPFKYDSKEIKELLRRNGDRYIADMVARFPKGKDFVFSEAYRQRKGQGKRLPELLQKAKVTLEKPFINLRGSCESEWIVRYGLKAACDWTGNSMVVAEKHYATIPKEIWDRATGETSRLDDKEMIRMLVEKYGVDGIQDLIAETVGKTATDTKASQGVRQRK